MADLNISSVTGLLDVEAIVKNLTLSKQREIQKLSQERALLQAKAASLSNLQSSLRDIKSFLEGLNVDNLFKGKTAVVSDPSVLGAEVTEDAPNINLSVKVNSLAQNETRISSGGVQGLNDQLSGANFTLKYWTDNENSLSYSINFSGGTLNDLVKAINEAQDKVIASVYFDGSNYKLMLAEKDIGASSKETDPNTNAYVIEVTGLPSELRDELGELATTPLQNSKNARLQIGSTNGPEITSPTNSFKIISGLTLNALKTSENFVQINVKDSYDKATEAFKNLFNKINGVINLVNELTKQNSPFQGNQTITHIKSSFFTLTKPIQELGLLNLDEKGNYSLNSATFDSLVQKGQIDKIKRAIEKTAEGIDKYTQGLMKTFQKYQQTQDDKIKSLENKAKALQESLAKEENKLRLTFSKIEGLMYQNEQLKARLENFVVSLSEASKKG